MTEKKRGKAGIPKNPGQAIRIDCFPRSVFITRGAKKQRRLMRKRESIEKDFNHTMPSRKDEFMVFQREKLLLETQLNILELLENLSVALKAVLNA